MLSTANWFNFDSMFSDLKVIDLSTVLAGPTVGSFFSELGAEVVKIEHPKHKDVTRSWRIPNEKNSITSYFSSCNYNKSYQFLDLTLPTDYHQFLTQLVTADLLLMNFKKGDDEKLGLTEEKLRAVNPNLIIAKISGFGSDSDRVAYDLILQAETGFMSMNGEFDSMPLKMPVAFIDVLAAHQLKEGILISLLKKQKTNVGSTVEVSLYDAAICSLVNQASNYLMNGNVPFRMGSLHPNIAPYGELFSTKDKALVTFAIGSNKHFEWLCILLNCPEILKDPRFLNNVDRVANRKMLFELLEPMVKQQDSYSLSQQMSKKFIPMGIVKNLDEVFKSPRAKQLIKEELIDGEMTRRVSQIAFKWK